VKLPKHLAIIMDGNGRWAKARGHNRFFGHIRGARVVKNLITECTNLNLKYLTLYTFSTENWFRPPEEVSFLMMLLQRKLRRERALLVAKNVRFRVIGDLGRLPSYVREEALQTIEATKNNTGMVLTFALSYGGRQELVQATKAIAAKVASGELKPEDITEAVISENMPSAFLPDPDIILRTSGEERISNFFLWQAAYSEIYFEEVAWPDFTAKHLHETFRRYAHCERRFGRTGEQMEVIS
jgi:undecaprenyl diphosphate synthase